MEADRDRRCARAMTMADDLSRRSASVGASIVLHAIALAMLARSGTMRLAIDSTPLLLTFVEAARHSAAPGNKSEELRLRAGPAVPDVAVPPAASARTLATGEPVAAPAARPEPQPKVRKPPPAKTLPPAPELPSAPAPRTDGAASIGSERAATTAGSHSGSATQPGGPQWAASAKVRYEELLFAWMNRHKEYPLLAQRRGIQGRGSVRVRIDRGGRVLERALASSTGQSLLDQAALDMVRRASPFPAVPADYDGGSFEFVAPIEYRLR